MQKIIIGVVGKKLSGKGTFGKYVKECIHGEEIALLSFSDVLRDTLVLWGLPVTRHNLQRLAIVMNMEFGEGTLTRAVLFRLEQLETEIVVVDGIRWLSDRDMLRSMPNFVLVYIVADIQVRYVRRKAGQKTGEAEVSWEQFLEEEKAYTEQFIEEIGRGADCILENNGTREDYRKKVLSFVENYLWTRKS